MDRDDRVQAIVPVKQFDDTHFLIMATKNGLVKKTVLSAYGNPRRTGINAIALEEGDELIEATVTDGSQDIILAKTGGKAIRFPEARVRAMGRTTRGVIGVKLEGDDAVVSMVAVKRETTLMTVTQNGYGKRSEIADYRVTGRGGLGIITIKTTERNGKVVGVKEVVDGEELMLITRMGQVIRMPVAGLRVMGRNTQGVRLVELHEGDEVSDVARVVIEDGAPAGSITAEIVGEEEFEPEETNGDLGADTEDEE